MHTTERSARLVTQARSCYTSDPQQACKPGRTDLGRRASRLQITEEYHGTDVQLKAVGGKALETPEGTSIC